MQHNHVCVGGFDLVQRRNVRLLTQDGQNQPATTPFEIGGIWEINYVAKANCVPPHIEDVYVQSADHIGAECQMVQFLQQNVPIIQGELPQTFDGLLRYSGGGAGYIARSVGVPTGSVCLWRPNVQLTRDDFGEKIRYALWEGMSLRHVSYVGLQPPLDQIEANTLLRLSLARWWRPNNAPAEEEEKCFLQLSGYYI